MYSARLTIIPIDGLVHRDQGPLFLDLSTCNIPDDIHALQWNTNLGHIEYKDTRHNLSITDLPEWALVCVQLWETVYQQMLASQETPPE